MSDVLAGDESLVEVFARAAPPLAKLRSRTMRRVMARLVTVEQAARMANVSAEALLRDLNAALGLPATDAEGGSTARSDDAGTTTEAHHECADDRRPVHATEVEVDVRDDLRAGREPFAKIMAAVGALGADDALHLRTIFEPMPLYAVLAKRGFAHDAQAHADDDWSVWFWRRNDHADTESAEGSHDASSLEAVPRVAPDAATEPNTVLLDVRGLEPPEPLVRTLAALDTLPEDHMLIQMNTRVPQLLVPLLAERGFACDIDESRADRVLVRIWRSR